MFLMFSHAKTYNG